MWTKPTAAVRHVRVKETVRILVVGGGYVGMYTALRLQKRLKHEIRSGEAEIVVVEPRPYMTYQPFLPEAAAGTVSPRHVVVPLRRVLPGCRLLVGEVRRIDHARRTATVSTPATEETGGEDLRLPYDLLVLAPGSVPRTLPVPGLAEHGIGFKTVEEAIGLRNHVLEQLDIASSTRDPAVREAALTFVFVGGGYAGVEALAELEDMARYACRYHPALTPDDMHWILVEATDRVLPEVGGEMGRYVLSELRGRNVDVRLETRLVSCEDRLVVLSDGSRLPARTLVWTAGVKAHPVLESTDLPRDARGRLRCTAALRVQGTEDAWAAGDAAAVPDLTVAGPASPGRHGSGRGTGPAGECAPNAQHARRQARTLADNIVAHLRGTPQKEYRHRYAGSVASLGVHKGVAHVYGRKVKGRPAWLIHRGYHLSRMPTFNRKVRVLAEWTLAGLFKREIVPLGSLEHPRAEFEAQVRRGEGPDGGAGT